MGAVVYLFGHDVCHGDVFTVTAAVNVREHCRRYGLRAEPEPGEWSERVGYFSACDDRGYVLGPTRRKSSR